MSARDFDLGGALAFALAAGMTIITVIVTATDLSVDPIFALWWATGSACAWFGFWGWRRRRWLLAALGFFLAIGWPGGFVAELSMPFAFAFFVVSLVRARHDRVLRKRAGLVDRSR